MSLVTTSARNLLASIALAFAGFGVSAQPVVSAAALDAMSAQVAREGSTRVIVRLNVDNKPEHKLDRAARQRQRDAIRGAQDQAEEEIVSGNRSRVSSRMKSVPAMTMEVDQAGLEKLRASRRIKRVEQDIPIYPQLSASTEQIGAPQLWSAGVRGNSQVVAVLDTGVEKSHPFFGGRVVSEACYSSNFTGYESLCPGGVTASTAAGSGAPCVGPSGCDHGTHVAGIVAGSGGPGGLSGVAPAAKIISIQVFSRETGTDRKVVWSSDVFHGLERVYELRETYPIASANLSLGGGRETAACSQSSIVKEVVDALRDAGIATIASAGNDGYRDALKWPACIPSVISVGSTDGSVAVSNFSNVAPFVTLMAPGGGIFSSGLSRTYTYMGGTSMAAPHVAGAWALLKQARPTITVDEGVQLLRQNAQRIVDQRSGGIETNLRVVDLSFLRPTGATLSLSKIGSGTGRIVSSPAGIDCGSVCAAGFDDNAKVSLTAVADSGSRFIGWGGACSGTSACTVTMSGAQAVTALFDVTHFQVAVLKTGTGSGTVASSPAGLNCGSTCNALMARNTTVSLSATPAAGSRFTGWGGACSGTGACSLSMVSSHSVTANFTVDNVELRVTLAGTGSGVVSSSPSGLNCGSACVVSRPHGSTTTLSAKPASGSVFLGWSGGGCSGTGSCSVTLQGATQVTATFAKATNSLTVDKDGTGLGSVTSSPAGLVCGVDCASASMRGAYNASYTLTAEAAAGSRFDGWSGACSGTGACVVTTDSAKRVVATFTRVIYRLAVSKIGDGAGTVRSLPDGLVCGSTCAKSFRGGLQVTLTATPARGSAFTGWSGACAGSTGTTCTVSMNSGKSVTASFARASYSLGLSKIGRGKIVGTGTALDCGATCTAMLPVNSVVALTAKPGRGYRFDSWGGACRFENTAVCSVTMDAARTVKATFVRK